MEPLENSTNGSELIDSKYGCEPIALHCASYKMMSSDDFGLPLQISIVNAVWLASVNVCFNGLKGSFSTKHFSTQSHSMQWSFSVTLFRLFAQTEFCQWCNCLSECKCPLTPSQISFSGHSYVGGDQEFLCFHGRDGTNLIPLLPLPYAWDLH